ncbi:HAD family hydrolase [Bifidobacterium sp.]|jgi:HAD superfamily hydrolase (TIGR01509 family)|uniref:HAD family hydrolase n=1 Tax=Bifidobacterium sp. TaxID=41200 RepID=UPI0025B88F2D|nr:HAD family phosphatase [Bifidobacterium sp.]MCH4210015.1 HAD family phosphatase [Bifidobacterium sp.]MCI1225421.1 HAD family phosphatase [Bifidobacterium sp.]
MTTMLLKAVLWDLDGTLIDSEPIWHEAETQIALAHGGQWNEELAWSDSGKPVTSAAQHMIDMGTQLTVDEIANALVEYVYQREMERMPWVEGAEDVLRQLAKEGIPSVLVTASPRKMAQNLVDQAPQGAFAGFVCGSDDLPKKPDPAPYLAAGRVVGAEPRNMPTCIAIEDSISGLMSAAASGATTIAQTGFNGTDVSDGPQFASISGYAGLGVDELEHYVRLRLRKLEG